MFVAPENLIYMLTFKFSALRERDSEYMLFAARPDLTKKFTNKRAFHDYLRSLEKQLQIQFLDLFSRYADAHQMRADMVLWLSPRHQYQFKLMFTDFEHFIDNCLKYTNDSEGAAIIIRALEAQYSQIAIFYGAIESVAKKKGFSPVWRKAQKLKFEALEESKTLCTNILKTSNEDYKQLKIAK